MGPLSSDPDPHHAGSKITTTLLRSNPDCHSTPHPIDLFTNRDAMTDSREDIKGASNNERLLAAARADNEELLLEVFEQGGFDINCQDGLGNTPLHNAVLHGSTDVLEHILSHEECDVDPINRIDRATPLHLAVQLEHPELRNHVVESLLEAGANTSIADKNGATVLDIVPLDDAEIRAMIRKANASNMVSRDDIASDDDGEPGSGSGSDSE